MCDERYIEMIVMCIAVAVYLCVAFDGYIWVRMLGAVNYISDCEMDIGN